MKTTDGKPGVEENKKKIIAYFRGKGFFSDAYGNLKKTVKNEEYRIKLQEISYRREQALRDSSGKMIKWLHVGGGYYSEFDVVDGKLVRIEKCVTEKKTDRNLVIDDAIQSFGRSIRDAIEPTMLHVIKDTESLDTYTFKNEGLNILCTAFKNVLCKPENEKERRIDEIVTGISKMDSMTGKEISDAFKKMQDIRDEGMTPTEVTKMVMRREY